MLISCHDMMYSSMQAAFQVNEEPLFWCTNPNALSSDCSYEKAEKITKISANNTSPITANTFQNHFNFNVFQSDWQSSEDVFWLNRNENTKKNQPSDICPERSFTTNNHCIEKLPCNNINTIRDAHRITQSNNTDYEQAIKNLPSCNAEWTGFDIDLKDIVEETNEKEKLTKPLQDVLEELQSTMQESSNSLMKEKNTSFKRKDKIRLHEFILDMLTSGNEECVKWNNKSIGEFDIIDSAKIAKLWGKIKSNPTMTYEKLARALRHYYKLDILETFEHKEKLRYRFSRKFLAKKKILKN